ncbi:DNA-directed RNA polymerase subunit A' [Candidatus Woesearchaeota archaeon]|jgi:DNA-directed RNA polymerase subunit A'|nr:DNA-directed RNA polymerase subunit A' [Candidatus Woesearchaeota archaeon]MBT7402886.1 DNA-directed RNA polymerase subunit A' [Candidatus Woesearchaeota archaeon]
MPKEVITKHIEKISFGVVSPTLIKKIGVINVVTPEIYDADGYPVKKGLMDPNMGVIDPGLRCKTCGGRMKTCPGHFGYITLSKAVLHILYIDTIHKLLRSTCGECGRVLMNQKKLEDWTAKFEDAKRTHNIEKTRALMSTLFASLKTVKSCPYCTAKKKPVKLIKPTTFQLDTERLWPDQIREWFEKIPDTDLAALGYDPAIIRPEWLVLSLLLVPPITIRPSITLESGERSEDDLTHKLSDIVRVNQRLLENINAGAPEIIVEDLWDLLQYHVTTFFDNKVSQIPPARHRTRRPLKTLSQRLAGKEGRFRYNLAGKRVNFCARSVISPDPNIKINEVGVPEKVARELTITETVTDWNIKWLKTLIKNLGNYPSASYLIDEEGRRRKITAETLPVILEDLKPEFVVERQMIDGDVIIFNRQPSLHRMSMMGHIVRILPGFTFRINPAVCVSYNADFDGDEMNMHVPQTEEARAEARNILILDNQIVTPRYGLSIIGVTVDSLIGNYFLTKDMMLTKDKVSDLITAIDYDGALPKPVGKENGKDVWSGKQIFSLVLPKDLDFENEGNEYKNNKFTPGKFIVRKGQLIQGIADKNQIGEEGGALINQIYQVYGSEYTSELINKLLQLGLAVSKMLAYTMSISDLDIPEAEMKQVYEILKNTEKDAEKVVEEYEKNKIIPMPGKTVYETFEAHMLKTLNGARNVMVDIISGVVKEDTTLVQSAHAGSGDKVLNIALMSGFVGQQALRGERINFGYSGRTLSHFKLNELSPKAHGFISNGYARGMNPIELFFNAIVGRDSLMDTAMRTPKSGYMQRRLINALQDLKVDYDGTVRDSGRGIVQFKFGGDGVDVSKSNGGKIYVN